jgi:hypothetical protein
VGLAGPGKMELVIAGFGIVLVLVGLAGLRVIKARSGGTRTRSDGFSDGPGRIT